MGHCRRGRPRRSTEDSRRRRWPSVKLISNQSNCSSETGWIFGTYAILLEQQRLSCGRGRRGDATARRRRRLERLEVDPLVGCRLRRRQRRAGVVGVGRRRRRDGDVPEGGRVLSFMSM